MTNTTTTVHAESGYDYDREGEELVTSYFGKNGARRLVEHQLHSFNHFVEVLAPRVIGHQSIHCKSDDIKGEHGLIGNRRCSYLEANVQFENVEFIPPKHRESNGAEHWLFPYEARLRHLHYKSNVMATMRVRMVEHNDLAEVVDRHDMAVTIQIMSLPVMVGSHLCNLVLQPLAHAAITRECLHDQRTYFLTKGVEKELNPNERPKENGPTILLIPPDVAQPKYAWKLEIRALAENGLSAPKLMEIYVLRRSTNRGHPLRVFVSKLEKQHTIPLFAVFYAMGAQHDEEIFQYLLGSDPHHPENQLFLPYVLASRDEIYGEHIRLREFPGETMQLKACNFLSTIVSYKPEQDQRNEQVIERRRLWYSQQLVNDDFLPNVERNPLVRMRTLGLYVRKLLGVATGLNPPDIRDAYTNKRIDLPGITINNLLRSLLTMAMKTLQRNVSRELRAARRNGVPLRSIFNTDKLTKLWNPKLVEQPFQRAFSTGDFSTTPTATNKVGLAQQTQRTSMCALLAQARKINTPLDKNGEMIAPRWLQQTTWGLACPSDTPDSSGLGMVKAMALGTVITSMVWSEPVLQLLRPRMQLLTETSEVFVDDGVRVLLNGAWIGLVRGFENVASLVRLLRNRKRVGYLNRYLSIVFDPLQRELRIGTDGGRICRPLLVVENGKLLLTADHWARIRAGTLTWEMLCDSSFDAESGGAIEYLDAEEQTMVLIASASRPVDRLMLNRFEYAEIHPMLMFGFMMNMMPFPERNPAIRDGYQNGMGKQANGLFATNATYRMDRSANLNLTSDRPLLTTLVHELTNMNYTPAGNMAIVALMSDDCNNQEDSISINQACIDRGFANTLVFTTMRSESDKNTVPEKVRKQKPTPETTIRMKAANYDRVNEEGFIDPNQYVKKSDIVLLRTSKIPKKRLEGVVSSVKSARRPTMRAAVQEALSQAVQRGATKAEQDTIVLQIQREFEMMPTPQYEDHSVGYYQDEKAAVERNFVGRDADGNDFAKTTLRKIRPPIVGDKFNTRCGQKGTFSDPRRDSTMPYFLDDGTVPDIVMNPHCEPSRMTGELIVEQWLGELLVALGYLGNGTAFKSFDMKKVVRLLKKLGLHPYGERWMVDGRTGRVRKALVFSGALYYQRLRHMVVDKEHCRDEGQMVVLTRQPSEGRARDGGFKMGEMEKDNMLAHGVCGFLHDRMYKASDAFQIYVCRDCGVLAVGNSGEERGMPHPVKPVFYCRLCGSSGEFVRMKLPFCFWLTLQEFEANNLCVQFAFPETVQQRGWKRKSLEGESTPEATTVVAPPPTKAKKRTRVEEAGETTAKKRVHAEEADDTTAKKRTHAEEAGETTVKKRVRIDETLEPKKRVKRVN